VGNIVRMDSGDFLNKREGFCVWDCFRVIEDVRSLQMIDGSGLISVFRGGMIAPILGGQLLTADVSFPVYTSAVTFVVAGICVLFLKEAEKQEGEENQSVVLH
jgi:hypothetical protein